jgi:DNA replication and repair protein RecF
MLGGEKAGNLVYLVDDMGAELDDQHRQRICRYLISTKNQIVATGIEQDSLLASWNSDDHKLFHVEHGRLKSKENMNDGR